MTAFGIDFGTTNSVLATLSAGEVSTVELDEPEAAWAELGFDKVLPTVLAETGGAIEFGWKAKANPNRLAAVKRLFASDGDVTVGSHTLQLEEAGAIFFKQIKERAALSGLSMDQAVVTVPANSRGKARSITKAAAGLAGIEVLQLLNEPTAAAMAYCRQIDDDQLVLVFDFGGGTLDVTILRNCEGVFIEEASKGVGRLGGVDLDEAFRESIQSRVPSGSRLDLIDLELAKVKLSTQESTILSLLGGGTLEVTRGELEEAIRPLILRCRGPIDQCLSDMGSPSIDHLVLVGGSSKIPLLQSYVREWVRLDPMPGIDPMTAIAEGAALAAGILTREVEDLEFFVSTEHALGTIVNNPDPGSSFSVLIGRNTKLPAEKSDGYVTLFDDQESVAIQVIEGDPALPLEHEDNVVLKVWEVPLDPKPVSESGFLIRYRYDEDGILHVTATMESDGAVILDEQLTPSGAASKKDLVAIRKRLDNLRTAEPDMPRSETSGLDPESAIAVRKATDKIMPFIDDVEKEQFQTLIDDLKAAEGDEIPKAREELDAAIRNNSYLL